MDYDRLNPLLSNLNRLHTTELGKVRVMKNLCLETTDHAVDWCRDQISLPDSLITRKGKNWYITTASCVITVNASSYTMITAHKRKA